MSSGSSVLVLALALSVASPHRAEARGAYNSADTSGVMVDMGALEDLGGGSNLPDLLLGRPGQPAASPSATGSRGMLLQPDPNRGIHSRMLVNPGLMPPKGHGVVTLTPPPGMAHPPGLTELPELVPVPPAASTQTGSTPTASDPVTSAPAAVAPPPAPAPVAESPPTPAPAEPAPQQTASAPATDPAPAAVSRPAAPAVSGSALTTLSFSSSQTDLSADARAALDASLAKLGSSGSVQVLAYASGDRDNPSKARRTSLSRALAVRTYLIDKGIASNRIDVRALGDQSQGGSADRVDLFAGS
ncbi:hypothetical protein GCM10027256_24520 [Novispirillum itersonii subsp. nipponicum]